MSSWSSAIEQLWLMAALPALALAGLILLLLLRLPTFTRLPEAFRAVRDPGGDGHAPARALGLATAASLGAGAAVAGAMAVALGGAGGLAWLWIFGIVLAPLRVADVLLARTSPPGKAAGGPRGNLAARLEADASPAVRALGVMVLVATGVAATLGVMGVHGAALRDVCEAALPGSGLGLTVGAAVLAAALAITGRDKPWLGWVAGGSVVALLLLAFLACLVDPGRALGAVLGAIEDALGGAQPVGAFSGASAEEIARAALTLVLPPMVLSLGADGALAADSRGSTKAVASAALLSTLAHVVVATVVGASLLATGAFSRRVESERRLTETVFVDAPFETRSQRLEPERQWTGYLRVVEGRPQAEPFEAATERGMIDDTRFLDAHGEPGDFALRIRGGHPVLMLVPDDAGALQQVEPSRMREIRVTGRMLPRRGPLLVAAMTRAGGEIAVRLSLAVLLVLCAVAAAALGLALSRTLEARLGPSGARAASVAPAIALAISGALGAEGSNDPPLSALGLLAAAVVALAVSLAILSKSVEVAKL